MESFYIKTLGCRLNQSESAMMAKQLEDAGLRTGASPAESDYIIIHSCTVTAAADSKTLALARRFRRENLTARIVVAGCMSQVAQEKLCQVPEVDAIVGNDEKNSIVQAIRSKQRVQVKSIHEPRLPLQLVTQSSGNERVNVKIQDGCNNRCSYCLVTVARGPSRSIEPERIIQVVQQLSGHYPEIVLSGVHIGSYGHDFIPSTTLSELVARLLEIPGLGRLRLSSIEPTEIDPLLLELLDHPRFCPHLHVSLQSAHDTILQSMNRPYQWLWALERIIEIRERSRHLKLGTDIIVGYPGESDEMYQTIARRIADSPLNYLHVFPYSPRQGTPAATLPHQVSGEVKKERAVHMRQVGKDLQRSFHRTCLGQVRPVILESGSDYLKGESDNYISVRVRENSDYAPVAMMRLVDLCDDGQGMLGELL
ncbi:tRNA (N(6)-L-threonylcarbamoyladenosine(37)-C(2))-methylthiotransferase MtaB [Desulfurispira natronophila]|uniref:Threonylcarbamoyladenosine tRNA methylthiotransferase MtaB n=1 Tax=Desulfurispira natronophila TaxID=682562 RepID=A0A7W7Y3Z3_9BACT|nr:threonylcarbamoyladenosine tRNA methylthiotransferase MtaB [Desulfurispira natronophila]